MAFYSPCHGEIHSYSPWWLWPAGHAYRAIVIVLLVYRMDLVRLHLPKSCTYHEDM
jgi:hypothetical protein